jgi:DNA topoisomerase-3
VVPSGITPDEQKVYDLIARRFIAAFYPECKVSNTTVMGKVDQLEFKAGGKQILHPGWREVYADDLNSSGEKHKEEERILPLFTEGESGPHEPFIHEGKTSPPKQYTEATLLRAMETAGKQIEDEEMRELMKDNGIGRPSTRANIIETLFKRKYIVRQRKNILPTPTGIQLIEIIDNQLLKSPELTGQWERKLRQIEKGEYAPDLFKSELIQLVRELTDEVVFSTKRRIEKTDNLPPLQTKSTQPKQAINWSELVCPKCKTNALIMGKTAIGCSNFKVCLFKIPKEFGGKKLTDKQLKELATKGKTGVIKGLILPDGSSGESKLVLDTALNVAFL